MSKMRGIFDLFNFGSLHMHSNENLTIAKQQKIIMAKGRKRMHFR